MDFESSSGLRNTDYSACTGFVSDVIQEKMTKLKERRTAVEEKIKEFMKKAF